MGEGSCVRNAENNTGSPRFARDVTSRCLILRRTGRTIDYDLLPAGAKILLEVIPSSSSIDFLVFRWASALLGFNDRVEFVNAGFAHGLAGR